MLPRRSFSVCVSRPRHVGAAMRNDAAPIFFSSSQPRGGGASAVASVATSIPLTHGIRVGTRPPRPRTSATPSTPNVSRDMGAQALARRHHEPRRAWLSNSSQRAEWQVSCCGCSIATTSRRILPSASAYARTYLTAQSTYLRRSCGHHVLSDRQA